MTAEFNVTNVAYGAVGNGKRCTDAAITNGAAVLTSASNPFAAGDVGKAITVPGAGAAGAVLATTILGYTNAGSVTLAVNASTTVTGKDARWGTEDTTAIQAAIDAAVTAGGGIVYCPPGTYLVKKLHLKSGVTLCGAGRNATKFLNHGAGIDTTVTVDTNATNFGLHAIQLVGRRDLTGFTTLYLDAVSYGSVSNVQIDGGEHVGLQTNGATHHVSFDDILIGNIVSAIGGTGGIGMWLFFGAHDCTVSNVIIDGVDHHGFVLDPGTSTGGGADVSRIVVSNLIVLNFGKKLTNQTATSYGIQASGAVDCVFDGFSITKGDTSGSSCVGLQLTQDQNGQIPRGTTVANGAISEVNEHGMLMQGMQRCSIRNIRMHNIGKSTAAHNAIFLYIMDDDVLGGVTPAGNLDNSFSGICVTNDAGTSWTGYNYAVRLQGTATSPCYRNRFVDCRFGVPATAYVYQGDAQNPIVGPDGNVFSDDSVPARWQLDYVEDFLAGSTSNNDIGQSDFTTSGGVFTIGTPTADHPGVVHKTTSASSGTFSALYSINSGTTGAIHPDANFDVTWIVKLGQVDANTTIRAGLMMTPTGSPTDGVYLEHLGGDTNWFGVTRASSSQTRVDMGVAPSTNWVRLRVWRHSSTAIGFQVDAGTAQYITATIPSATLAFAAHVTNLAAADKTWDADYGRLRLVGLAR